MYMYSVSGLGNWCPSFACIIRLRVNSFHLAQLASLHLPAPSTSQNQASLFCPQWSNAKSFWAFLVFLSPQVPMSRTLALLLLSIFICYSLRPQINFPVHAFNNQSMKILHKSLWRWHVTNVLIFWVESLISVSSRRLTICFDYALGDQEWNVNPWKQYFHVYKERRPSPCIYTFKAQ